MFKSIDGELIEYELVRNSYKFKVKVNGKLKGR